MAIVLKKGDPTMTLAIFFHFLLFIKLSKRNFEK